MNKFFISISQISNTGFQLFLILFITKTEPLFVVGVYGLILAYINPIITIFKLGIPQFILSIDDNFNENTYNKVLIFNCLVFTALSFLVGLFLSHDYKCLFLSTVILKAGQMIREALESSYIKNREENKLYSVIFIGNIFSVLFFLIIYYLFNNLSLSILAAGIIFLISSAFDVFKIFNSKSALKLKKSDFVPLIKITGTKFLNSFKSSLPRLVGQIVLTLDELGVFTLLQQSVNLLDILNNILMKSNNRQIVNGFFNHKKRIVKNAIVSYSIPLLVVLVISTIVLYFAGDVILEFVFNEKMSKYSTLLILMVFYKNISIICSIPKISFIIYNKVQITLSSLLIHALIISVFLLLLNFLLQLIIVLSFFELLLFLSLSIFSYKLFKN